MTISNEQARGMIGTDAKVARQPAVQSALDHQEKMIGDLLEKVKSLENRMIPVLREAAPQTQEENKDLNESCGLAGKISTNNNALRFTLGLVESMLDRLEI